MSSSEVADPTFCRSLLQLGDRVKIAPGTLAWSGEPMLRKMVGLVISTHDDHRDKPRVTVEYPGGKILSRREMSVFALVERAAF